MQSIEYNKENYPTKPNIWYTKRSSKTKKKQITAHVGVKGNEEADKAAKQAIDMPGVTTTRLPYIDYYVTIWRAKNSKWQREW